MAETIGGQHGELVNKLVAAQRMWLEEEPPTLDGTQNFITDLLPLLNQAIKALSLPVARGGGAKVYALLDYEADGDALISVHATEESANKAKELVAPIRCWIQECDVVAPPPQDGQGDELQFVPITDAERKAYEKETAALGPPRGGSSSDLADSDSLNVAAQEILKPHWPVVHNMEENEARQKEVERIAEIVKRREEIRTRTPDWQGRPPMRIGESAGAEMHLSGSGYCSQCNMLVEFGTNDCPHAKTLHGKKPAPSRTEGASSPADARTELVQKEVGEGLREALTVKQVEDIHKIIERHSTDVIDYELATDDINALRSNYSMPSEVQEGLETLDELIAELKEVGRCLRTTNALRGSQINSIAQRLAALGDNSYKCENGHTFNAQAHSPHDLPPEHCPECGNRKVALEQCKESLDSVWAAIGDALCSGRGIETLYANKVATECRVASDAARAALAAPAPKPAPPAEPDARFEAHTKAVADFLNELYVIMVDPLPDGPIKVAEMQRALLEAAKRDREYSHFINYYNVEATARLALERWRMKPHNAKWWKKIDGTPIPNDLIVCISEDIAVAVRRAAESKPPR